MIQIKDFDMPRLGRCSTGTLEIELLHNKIDALREQEILQLLNIIQRLSAHLALVVVLCVPVVYFGLAVLAHHDDGRCEVSQALEVLGAQMHFVV